MRQARAFTLVEILIVVVLLGILAVVVVPLLADGATSARESALAGDLKLMRTFIQVYTGQHREVSPGYPDGDQSVAPTEDAFRDQATSSSTIGGQTAPRGTAGFRLGPYLSRIPVNPFNKLSTVRVLADGEALPAAASGDFGWVCRPQTGEIRADNVGADITGREYYEY